MAAVFGPIDGRELVLGAALVAAGFHDGRARRPQAAVVARDVLFLHENLALHAGGVRQRVDPVGVGAGHARRRAQRQRRGAPGGHVDGLHAEQVGEERARALEQLVHLDEPLAGDLHRLPDRFRRAGPADRGARADRVDRAAHAELLVVVDRFGHSDLRAPGPVAGKAGFKPAATVGAYAVAQATPLSTIRWNSGVWKLRPLWPSRVTKTRPSPYGRVHPSGKVPAGMNVSSPRHGHVPSSESPERK